MKELVTVVLVALLCCVCGVALADGTTADGLEIGLCRMESP